MQSDPPLRDAARPKRLTLGSDAVGVFEWEPATGALHWDDRLLALFDVDRATFDGTIDFFLARLHPEDLPRVTEAMRGAVDTCGDYAVECRVLLRDGGVRWLGARGRVLAGPDGRAERMHGTAYATSRGLDDSDARLARVLESMPSAFFQLTPAWRFSYVNAETERVLGVPREELLGHDVWELFPDALGHDFERHYREAVETGEPVSFEAYYPPPLDAWYLVRVWPEADGLSVFFDDVTERRRSTELLDSTVRGSELLAEVSASLTGTLDTEEAVGRLAGALVPELADWCLVTLVDDRPGAWRQRLRDVGWWHADPAARTLVDRYAECRIPALTDDSFVAQALNSAEPVVVPSGAVEAVSAVLEPGEAQDLLRGLAPEAAVVVALPARGRTVGLVSAFRGPGRETFSPEDVRTLREIAVRAGLALDNARLYGEQRDLAEGLQRSLLTDPPVRDDLDIAVRYEPAGQAAQVGGDWYDAFVQPDGDLMVVIGDVVGHDVAAAAAMGQLRSLLRGIAVHAGGAPTDVLRGVDRAMETLALGTTATAVVARIEPVDGAAPEVRWSNAGHPPPVLISPDGLLTTLQSQEPDLLLGLDPETEREETRLGLEPGATLLLFTDGLVERRGRSLEDGLRQLHQELVEIRAHEQDLESVCDELLRRMVPEDRREDDVALLAVRLR